MSAVTPRLPPSLQSVPRVSDNVALQARFRAGVEAIYVGDLEAAANPLVDVVRAGSTTRASDVDVAWPALLLFLLDRHESAGLDANVLATLGAHRDPRVAALSRLARARSVTGAQALRPDDDIAAFDAAVSAYEHAADDDYFGRLVLAWSIPWRTQVDEKLARLRAVEAIDPGPAMPTLASVFALVRAGRSDDAVAVANDGLLARPENRALAAVVLRDAIERGDLDDDDPRLKALLRSSPNDIETQFFPFDLALRSGRCGDARDTITRLIHGPISTAALKRAGGLGALALASFGCIDDAAAVFHDVVAESDAADAVVSEFAVGIALVADLSGRADVVAAVFRDVGVGDVLACDAQAPAAWSGQAQRLIAAERAVRACPNDNDGDDAAVDAAAVDAAIDAATGGAAATGVRDAARRTWWLARAHPEARARHLADVVALAERCKGTSLSAEQPCRALVVAAIVGADKDLSDDDRRLIQALWPGPDPGLLQRLSERSSPSAVGRHE